MTWWIWVIAGVALLVAELTCVSAEFYLLFVGAAAILTGLCAALIPQWPLWSPWILFILLALAGVKLFRRALAERFRVTGMPPPGLSAIGQSVQVTHGLAPAAEGRAEFRGASWGIRNGSDNAIPAGSHAQIVAIDGLTLVVEPQLRR
jgi:inner membrane protein